MPRPITRHTITYKQPGTEPPVYLAGTFSEPQWVPQAMDNTQDANGEYVFTYQVFAFPGHDYQFKFRIGEQDQWVLDDNSPVVTDSNGNHNNLLRVPHISTPKAARKVPGKVLNELGIIDIDSRPATPSAVVAETAAEVADTAEKLDQNSIPWSSAGTVKRPTVDTDDKANSEHNEDTDADANVNTQLADPPRTPLFAHECFGAYEFVEDGLDHTVQDNNSPPTHRRSTSGTSLFEDEVDMNDPTLERFPSQRGLVMDTLRKIQSSTSDDQVMIDNAPPSPRASSRRTSVDSADDTLLAAGSLSPSSPTSNTRRDARLSHSSQARTKSAVSLTAIAEEPKTGSGGILKPASSIKKAVASVFDRLQTPPTDEEDLVHVTDPQKGC